MHIFTVLFATIGATSAMTLFSYFVSAKWKKQFREPQLLQMIVGQHPKFTDERKQKIAGWFIHYSIGLMFIIVYDLIWTNTFLDPTWFCGILFGIASGVIGIFGWRTIFGLAPRIPRIDFKAYYLHLMIAHIVFALVAVAVYALADQS